METYSNITIATSGEPITISETFVRMTDTVKASSSSEGYYVYYKDDTSSEFYVEKDTTNSTDSDTLYTSLSEVAMIFNHFSGENATYTDGNGVEQPLPIGMYFLNAAYVNAEDERVYGLSVDQTVTDPATDLIVVWVPPILDDPVYNFLKNQKTTSVASGFPLRWRTKDTTSDYGRVGYSTRVSTKKTIQLPGDQDSI